MPQLSPTPPATPDMRSQLGIGLVVGSTGALVVLAIVIIVSAAKVAEKSATHDEVLETSRLLLSSLLPLFASWVGTVLAFYYTRENFQAATAGTLDIVRSFDQRLAVTPIDQVMMPRAAMIFLPVPAGGLKDVAMADIGPRYEIVGANGKAISRLHFLDAGGRAVAILHRSTWAEMQLAALRSAPPVDLAAGKLGALLPLKFPSAAGVTFEDAMTKTIAFVAVDQALSQAKAAMEAKPGCQDVLVTKTGAAAEPVLGWVSNVDIGRLSTA